MSQNDAMADRLEFPILANAAWLDFVNTRIRRNGVDIDLLRAPQYLLAFGRAAGLPSLGGPDPYEPDTADLKRSLQLRDTLDRAASHMVAGRQPARRTIEEINSVLGRFPVISAVERSGATWVVAQKPAAGSGHAIAWSLANDFAWFLAHGDPALVRRCAGDDCRLVFYDTSKNHRRRWCSMEFCGNRAKVTGHRARLRG